jgi:anion-transporting  ArsA/GET3 family ATPase
MNMNAVSKTIKHVLNRNLLFVHGKGGVGKTVVSHAIALRHAEKKSKTLWINIEDPTRPEGELRQLGPYLWTLNCNFNLAFEEYASMKIGAPKLTRLFLQNKVMRYLARAAPGVRELVLLGKIWFERKHYDYVVVDLPSTGYGLAMFQSTENFFRLFRGGPLHRDAESMLTSFRDPEETGHVIVSLPEEMPLQESLELNEYLQKILPENPAVFFVNRTFPAIESDSLSSLGKPHEWEKPVVHSATEYSKKRFLLEKHNLRLWRDAKVSFGELGFVPPPLMNAPEFIAKNLSAQLQDKDYL